jgi:limonene-1,2-epoxide hydrolase
VPVYWKQFRSSVSPEHVELRCETRYKFGLSGGLWFYLIKFSSMKSAEDVVNQFYTAFQNKDFQTMQSLYADSARFSDEVFVDLDSKEVRAMWEMLIRRGKDLQITFEILSSTSETAEARWIAHYSFSKSGNKVVNVIHACFQVKNGLIADHRDSFDFHRWASQALGISGKLLGWTSWMKRKVQRTARQGLQQFMTGITN